ncbi:MAG: endonuclease III domain-containing protein [Acidobacteriota bacterium]|nr:endonuclease III domain-containing protein [Acidobacteriota bacterium]
MPALKPARSRNPVATVGAMYRKLSRAWGRQHWWPAESTFEVIVGAILTQNTSWTNVERAMNRLRAANQLSINGIRALALPDLEQLIRSSGYFRQKARRLKNFVEFLDARYGGSLERLFATTTSELRAELLAQKGIGPETADSILLYAGNHEIFVVDAYTRRILERHEVIGPGAKYDEIRGLVERALRREDAPSAAEIVDPSPPIVHPPSAMSTVERARLVQVYNEMHGLLVQVGKHYCHRQEANCEVCPLRHWLPDPLKK